MLSGLRDLLFVFFANASTPFKVSQLGFSDSLIIYVGLLWEHKIGLRQPEKQVVTVLYHLMILLNFYSISLASTFSQLWLRWKEESPYHAAWKKEQ